MKILQYQKMIKNGFTLLEMMIAIVVIVVGLIGVMSLILQAIVYASVSSSRLAAAYLAQEGIEIVRNTRDTNWLEARTLTNPWDEGLTGCAGTGFIADYNHSYGPNQTDPAFPCYAGQFLNIDGSGFYSYSSGTQTKFKRKILVEAAGSDILNVLVEVSWSERGTPFSFSVRGKLYNWR